MHALSHMASPLCRSVSSAWAVDLRRPNLGASRLVPGLRRLGMPAGTSFESEGHAFTSIFFLLIRCGFKIVVPDRKDISLQEKDPQVLETVAVSL